MSKIIILSSGDVNGAYEAAYRIAKFSREDGHQVALVVKDKKKSDKFIISIQKQNLSKSKKILSFLKRKLHIKSYETPKTLDKYLFLDEDETKEFYLTKELIANFPFIPDLIIVGMVNGFITSTNLSQIHEITKAKIAFLTADMYPLTGGCHYAWNCKGYESDCSNCPAIIDKKDLWWPKINLEIKKLNIKKMTPNVISMSGWSNIQIRNSSLFNNLKTILQINSCIDTEIFNREAREFAKTIFNISLDSKVLFIGSQSLNDERKGLKYVIKALEILYLELSEDLRQRIKILLIGRDIDSTIHLRDKINFNTVFVEYINDYRLLSLLYQSADVFICGSIEDTGPMMVSEALACGTPVVGFNTGIIYNIIENNFNGIKVPVGDYNGIALGLKNLLEIDKKSFEVMSKNASQKIYQESSKKTVINVINNLLDYD